QWRLMHQGVTVPRPFLPSSLPFVGWMEFDDVLGEAATTGVSSDFFAALGVPMVLGTDLETASTDPAATNAVLSERFWREELGARPDIVGRVLRIEDQPFLIVGLAGGGFEGLRREQPDEIWHPLDAALSLNAPVLTSPCGAAL